MLDHYKGSKFVQSIAKSLSLQSNSLECNRCTILTQFRGTESQSDGSTSDEPKPWNPKNPQLPQTRRNMQEMQVAVAAASKSDVSPGYYNQHPREIRRAHKLIIWISRVSQLPDLKFQGQGHATTCRTSLKRILLAPETTFHLPQITCKSHASTTNSSSESRPGCPRGRICQLSTLLVSRIIWHRNTIPWTFSVVYHSCSFMIKFLKVI